VGVVGGDSGEFFGSIVVEGVVHMGRAVDGLEEGGQGERHFEDGIGHQFGLPGAAAPLPLKATLLEHQHLNYLSYTFPIKSTRLPLTSRMWYPEGNRWGIIM
jgi:hypothetical protein